MPIRRDQHIHAGTELARQTYNNSGVVLICFGNEHEFPTEPIVRAALAVDPQRVFKPISGRISHSRKPRNLPEDLRTNCIDDSHPYSGWYGNNIAQTWANLQIFPPGRMTMLGEFGAEALDAYETMRDHSPSPFKPPAPESGAHGGTKAAVHGPVVPPDPPDYSDDRPNDLLTDQPEGRLPRATRVPPFPDPPDYSDDRPNDLHFPLRLSNLCGAETLTPVAALAGLIVQSDQDSTISTRRFHSPCERS